MDDLNLGSDETILRRIERIIISGVRHEVMLTSRRLILVEAGTGKIRREAEYSQIILAILGTNRLREPEISVTFALPGGEQVTEDLVFVHLPGSQNIIAADKCMSILKEHQVQERIEARRSDMTAPTRVSMSDAGPSGKGTPAARQATPDFSPIGTPYSRRQVQPEEKEGKMPSAMTIGAAVLLVLVVIAVFMMAGQVLGPKGTAAGQPAPVPPNPLPAIPITTTPAEDVTVPPPVVTAAPEPLVTQQPVTVPDNGFWLWVSYPGNYYGTIKSQGWNDVVNSSGTFILLMPVHDTLIEGSIGKEDGSGDMLYVKIFNGGSPVYESSTSKPYGTIDIHEMVGPIIMKNPSETPLPTPTVNAVPTPDTSIALKQVPANGTFVRVSYNGPFTGSISANGQERSVSGSGDQFFQVSLVSGGQIDGSMEKPDGTEKNLVVGIYKDGVLLTAVNTIKPNGMVEFHTAV